VGEGRALVVTDRDAANTPREAKTLSLLSGATGPASSLLPKIPVQHAHFDDKHTRRQLNAADRDSMLRFLFSFGRFYEVFTYHG
jgi:hypothetical protein